MHLRRRSFFKIIQNLCLTKSFVWWFEKKSENVKKNWKQRWYLKKKKNMLKIENALFINPDKKYLKKKRRHIEKIILLKKGWFIHIKSSTIFKNFCHIQKILLHSHEVLNLFCLCLVLTRTPNKFKFGSTPEAPIGAFQFATLQNFSNQSTEILTNHTYNVFNLTKKKIEKTFGFSVFSCKIKNIICGDDQVLWLEKLCNVESNWSLWITVNRNFLPPDSLAIFSREGQTVFWENFYFLKNLILNIKALF